jgi:recombination protein RecT
VSNPNTQLSLRNEIESPAFRDAVAKVLPKVLPPERFVRVACTAMTRTPKLRECDRASFFSAMLSLAQTGLEPDGRRAHLIPFENRKRGVVECQLIIDYKGLAELAMRSGLLSYLHADVVRDGDVFEYSLGEIKQHVPHFLRRDADRPEKAGNVFAAYAVARFKDGSAKAEVMSVDEIDAIRRRSRAGQSGPWVTDWNEMAKKTAFRRLSKWLPLSPEYRDALDADADEPDTLRNVAKADAGAAANAAEFLAGETVQTIDAEPATDQAAADEAALFGDKKGGAS